MEKEFSDDTLLARWLEGRLSKEEEQELKSHPDFAIYQKIAHTSKGVTVPELDESQVWSKLTEKRQQKAKVRRFPLWAYPVAAAATIAIVFIAYLIPDGHGWEGSRFQWTTAAKTFYEFELPDASTVNMNADSYISFEQINWEDNRTINLEGEAFFDVQKGSTFTVKTPNGEVEVLGTEFNVRDRKEGFIVSCYEGKVEATSRGNKKVLHAGELAVFYPDGNVELRNISENNEAELWLKKETHYENMPLTAILEELERQYDVEVNIELDENPRLTGTFPHNELKKALRIIIGPKDIMYEIEEDGKLVRIFKKK